MSKAVTTPLPPPPIGSNGDRILRLPEVKQRTGVGRSFIYSADNFPKPIPLGDRAVGWLESEILAWVESRKAMRSQEAV